MSDQKSDAKKPPGSGAGDAAHSMRIPPIERPDSSSESPGTTPPAKTNGSTPKAAAAKTSAAKTSSKPAAKTDIAKTDKGRTRSTGPRPLSASDYARTTQASPDTTSVIPSVKDTEPVTTRTTSAARWEEDEPISTTTTQRPETTTSTQPATTDSENIGSRSAVLRMAYIEPWSVTRMAFAVSVALMIVAVVATAIFWLVLEVTGVWEQINGSVTSVLSDDAAGFDITDYLGFGRLVGLALVLSALNVVIMTVLATIAAHLYNLAAQLLGGFQVRFVSKS